MKKINKLINKENLIIFTLLLCVLYPVIELDYLMYDVLNNVGIPRLTTITKFIILPLLSFLIFIKFEVNKKRLISVISIYGLLFLVYFYFHCFNALDILNNGRYPGNFTFSIIDEIMYFFMLFIPLLYVYYFKLMDIKEVILKKVTILSSIVISIPILISNIFVFSISTYGEMTIDNIFSWFSLPYNATTNHPRLYASKFIFDEGNAIGIILLIILPFLYYFFLRSNSKKDRASIGALIIIHSITMIILGSRIPTYGAIIIPVVMMIIYIILVLMKLEIINKIYLLLLVIVATINCCIIPFSPAYNNMRFDATDHGFIQMDEVDRLEADEFRKDGEKYEEFSEEWVNFYVHMFESYSYMIGVTPPEYYTIWYGYTFDPGFWVDLIFDYHLYDRINGRQIQQIFMSYKYDPLTPYQKFMGMGYGTFMRGSIILEKDFKQQYLTLGPIGFALTMLPWLLMLVYLGIKLLFGYKKGYWNYLNIILIMVFGITIVGGYMSGHIMDEFSSSLLLAMFVGVLFSRLNKQNK